MAKYDGIFDFLFTSGRDLASANPEVQKLIDSGAISNNNEKWNEFWKIGHPNEDPVTFVDPDALPRTAFGGSIVDVRQPGAGGFKTLNSKLVIDDPNYGLISPLFNELDPGFQKNIYDMIGSAYTAILGGVIGLPSIASIGLGGVKQIGGLTSGTEANPQEQYQHGVANLRGANSNVLDGVDEFDLSDAERDVRDLYATLTADQDRQTTLYNYINAGN